MKADKSKMFSVAISSLKPEIPVPFPVFIFLLKNNRMVPIRLQGDEIGKQKYEELLNDKHQELWVPKTHEKEFQSYLEYLEKTGSLSHADQDADPNENQDADSDTDADSDSTKQETNDQVSKKIAKETKELLLQNENGNAISEFGKKLFQEYYAIEIPGLVNRTITSLKLKAFSDEFLKISLNQDPLYENILMFRSVQAATEHSVAVGSIAATVSAAIGRADPLWISNLITAATFHDIGLNEFSNSLLQKPMSQLQPQERLEYEKHVNIGVKFLKESSDPFPAEVIRMVEEHHEDAKGTGYPNGKNEEKIHEGSRILNFSNTLDKLNSGKDDGVEYPPKFAVKKILLEPAFGKNLADKIANILT